MFAYDLVRTVEPLGPPNPDPLGLPDLALMLTDVLVVFDHLKHTVTILANVYPEDDLDAPTQRARQDRRGACPAGGPGAAIAAQPARAESSRATVSLEHVARSGFEAHGGPDHRVHPRRGRLPGRALAALVGARAPGRILDLPRAAGGQPEPLHVLPGLRRLRDRRRQPRAADHGQRAARDDPADRRHAPARGEPGGGPADGRGAAGRPQGARRARDAGRPRAQRPGAGVPVREREGRRADGGRELQPRHAHRLQRHRDAAP